MSDKLKVIYIAGLYHSGTTVLDLTLGKHSNIVGLGEIYKLCFDGHETRCSCGEIPSSCEFWSEVTVVEGKVQKTYENVKTQFRDMFPNACLLDSSKCHPLGFLNRDSSKNFKGLNFWLGQEDVDLRVIHLTREALTWSSRINAREERFAKRSTRIGRFYRGIVASVPARLIQWSLGHKAIERFCRINAIPCYQISYEQMCYSSEDSTRCLLQFVGEDKDFQQTASTSHITVGNPVRHQVGNAVNLKFDVRPLFKRKSLISLLLLYFLQKQNSRYFSQ